MKKVLLASALIIICLALGLNFRTPQLENNETISPPKAVDHNNNTSKEEARVLDILGNSDNLSPQEWTAMQAWRKNVQQMASENTASLFLNGSSPKAQVALTFDDGPDEEFTTRVLDVLKQYHVPATFFFKGNQLDRYASVAKRAYEEGNLIASHAYSHQELDKMSAPDIEKEIVATDKAFERVLGVQPAMIRPPFGAINQDVLEVCSNNQEKVILWSIDTLDWSQPEPDHIAQNVLKNVRPGDIILMHSCKDREATVQALPKIIEGLQLKGYEMVDLSKLLKIPAYKTL
ncbi:MAG: polysaccharide deacetylase family protein [Syntrophomonas sp.]